MVVYGLYLLVSVQILPLYPVYRLPTPGPAIPRMAPPPSTIGPAEQWRVPDREQTTYSPRQWRASVCQNGASA